MEQPARFGIHFVFVPYSINLNTTQYFSIMVKRKTTQKKNNNKSQQDNISQHKKARTQDEKPAVLGKLYWHGEDEHVLITETKQQITVQGVAVEAQVTDAGLTLCRCEEKSDKDEKHNETTLHVQNQLVHRRSDLQHHKELVADLIVRLENEENEAVAQQLENEITQANRIVRLHTLNIKQLLAKTKVGVHFQVHTGGLSALLTAGRLLHPSFLPKTVCWVPVEMSLEVLCVELPVCIEDKFEELPFGLGEADCTWLHDQNIYDESDWLEKVQAKIENEYRPCAEAGNMYGQYLLGHCYDYELGGLVKDMEKAVELYTLAAEQGHVMAQFNSKLLHEKAGSLTSITGCSHWFT